jgi:phospholipase/carboxylesterase
MPEAAAVLEAIEVETGAAPGASVIWMHGLGADGHDFEPIVPELRLPGALAVRFVFPHAPMQPVTINNGYVMRAWYDVAFGDLEGRSRRADEAGVRASVAAIDALIGREVARGVPASRIALAGFSQGGAIALATGLRHAQALAGIMALSTYLPLAESLPAEASPANAKVPIFFAHGSADPVIPIDMARVSVQRLQALDYPVEWHEYPMQHSLHPQEIGHIRDWLVKVLSAPAPRPGL